VIHVVFERRLRRLAVFGPDGRLWHTVDAEGDAGRDGARPPYGPGFPIPPGHYHLTGQVEHESATPDDGPGVIYIDDLDTTTLQTLVHAGRARARDGRFEIARLPGPAGGLARYGRQAVAIRGGVAAASRSSDDDALVPYQPLTPSDGGARVHNADLARLMMILGPQFGQVTVVLTVLADPVPILARR
jgi:hypothetical protein